MDLRSSEALSQAGEVNDLLLKGVLYGISCRNYESAAEAIPGAIGLSSSTVSRGFVQASAAKLREIDEVINGSKGKGRIFVSRGKFQLRMALTLDGE